MQVVTRALRPYFSERRDDRVGTHQRRGLPLLIHLGPDKALLCTDQREDLVVALPSFPLDPSSSPTNRQGPRSRSIGGYVAENSRRDRRRLVARLPRPREVVFAFILHLRPRRNHISTRTLRLQPPLLPLLLLFLPLSPPALLLLLLPLLPFSVFFFVYCSVILF